MKKYPNPNRRGAFCLDIVLNRVHITSMSGIRNTSSMPTSGLMHF